MVAASRRSPGCLHQTPRARDGAPRRATAARPPPRHPTLLRPQLAPATVQDVRWAAKRMVGWDVRDLLPVPAHGSDHANRLGQPGCPLGGRMAQAGGRLVRVAHLVIGLGWRLALRGRDDRSRPSSPVSHRDRGQVAPNRYESIANLSSRAYGSPHGRTVGEWVLINKAVSCGQPVTIRGSL